MNPLKFLLDLDTKMRGMFTAADVLGKVYQALVSLERPLQMAHRAFSILGVGAMRAGRGIRAGMNAAGRQIGSFGKDAMSTFVGMASFEGLKALTSGIVNLGLQAIHTAGQAERTGRSFRAMLGAEPGERMLDWLDEVAGKTEFDDDVLKDFTAGLVRVGTKASKLPAMLGMALDIASVSKDPIAAMNEVGAAFENLQLKGEVDPKILRALGVQMPQFWKDLAKRTGMGIDDLKKKAADGKVDMDVILAQLQASIGKVTKLPTGGAGLEAGQGLLASFDRLKRVPDDLFKTLAKNPAGKEIAATFNQLAAELGPDGRIGGKIVAGLGEVFRQLGAFLKQVDWDKTSRSLLEIWESAKLVGSVFVTVFGWIATAFDWVGTALGYVLAQVFLLGEWFVGGLMDIGSGLGEVAGELTNWLKGLLPRVWEGAKELGSYLWKGMKDGILGGLSSIGGATGNLALAALGSFAKVLQIQSPSKVFEGFGRMTGEGYARGLESSEARVNDSMSSSLGVGVDAPATPLGASRGLSGSIALTVPITVNWSGEGGRDAAGDLAERIADLVPSQLQAALEQLRMELGGA